GQTRARHRAEKKGKIPAHRGASLFANGRPHHPCESAPLSRRSQLTTAFWSDQGMRRLGLLRPYRRLIGFLQPVLPGRGRSSKATLGAGAEPIAELRRNVAEW